MRLILREKEGSEIYCVKQAGDISQCGRCPSRGRRRRKAWLHVGIRTKWDLDRALSWELPGCFGRRTWAGCQAERIPGWEHGWEDKVSLGYLELREERIVPEGSKLGRRWGQIAPVFEIQDSGLRKPRKAE